MTVRRTETESCRAHRHRTPDVLTGLLWAVRVLVVVLAITPAAAILPSGWPLPVAAAASEAPEFGWPLPLAPTLTSTFGETRGSHFHAGIDCRTFGRTGYPVEALADGYVMRVRTSPWGYGRALYQRLDDGRIMVFAHLERFAPQVDARVRAAQKKQQRYSVDLWLQANEVRLNRGEVIAWSGDSGTGPPHLHLELRDEHNRPINPLLHGFQVEDGIPPTLRALGFIPFGIESFVDDGHEPVVLDLRWVASTGRFHAGRVPVISGRVGVSLLVHDRAERSTNRLGPYSLHLRVNGVETYRAAFDRFSYADAHQINLCRSYLPYGGRNKAFFNLFVRPGNRLEFYATDRHRGVLTTALPDGAAWLVPEAGKGDVLPPGLHALEIEARDVAGNVSTVALEVKVAPPSWAAAPLMAVDAPGDQAEDAGRDAGAETLSGAMGGPGPAAGAADSRPAGARITPEKVIEAPPGALAVERRVHPLFVEMIVRPAVPLAAAPAVWLGQAPVTVRRSAADEFRASVALDAAGPAFVQAQVSARTVDGAEALAMVPLSQRLVRPGQARTLSFGGGEATLVFGVDSAYEPLFPQWKWFVPEPGEELVPVGLGHDFGPQGVHFDARVQVRLAYPPDTPRPEQLGIYAGGEDGRWVFLGNEVDTGEHVVQVRVRQLGRVAVLRDVRPPQVSGLQPRPGSRLTTRTPVLAARIVDGGSGIRREADIRMELNGRRLISEYIPDADRVIHPVEEPLEPGAYELVVEVRDMSGNTGRAVSSFTVE